MSYKDPILKKQIINDLGLKYLLSNTNHNNQNHAKCSIQPCNLFYYQVRAAYSFSKCGELASAVAFNLL